MARGTGLWSEPRDLTNVAQFCLTNRDSDLQTCPIGQVSIFRGECGPLRRARAGRTVPLLARKASSLPRPLPDVVPKVLGLAPMVLGVAPMVVGVVPRVLEMVPTVLGVVPRVLGMVSKVLGPQVGSTGSPLFGTCLIWRSFVSELRC